MGTQIGSTKEGRSSSDPIGTASTISNHDVIQYTTATTLLTDQQELRSDRLTSDPIGDCYGRSNPAPHTQAHPTQIIGLFATNNRY